MISDIKLQDNVLILEGNAVVMHAADLVLDIVERRQGTDPNAPRRALVHNEHDGLTINFNGDYPAGVTIEGTVSLGSLRARSLRVGTIPMDELIFADVRTVSIGVNQIFYRRMEGASAKIVDLIDEVHALQSQVMTLVERIEVLERKLG